MADNNEEKNVPQEKSRVSVKGIKRVVGGIGKKFVVIAIIAVFVIGLIAALFNYMRDKDCINSNDPDSKFYRPYGPIARNNSVYISEDGTLMPEMSVDEMWEKDKRYARYLTKGGKDELAYLVNSQLVTQYPYIASAKKDQLNGTVKFYRNDSFEPMVYVKPEKLEEYVKKYNKGDDSVLGDALNSFTINPDASITVAYLSEASYSVTTDDPEAAKDAKKQIGASIEGGAGGYNVYKEESTLYTTNISYINYIQSYVLPFNFLWAIIVWGNSSHRGAGNAQDLAHAIATMAYNGEISLVIDDNNYTSIDTDTYNYELTHHYRGLLRAHISTTRTTVVNDGTTSTQNRTDRSTSSTVEEEAMDNVTKKIRDYTTVYEEFHSDDSPDLKIRKIESWCAVFNNDAVFDSEVTSNEDKPDKSTLNDTEEKLIKTHKGKTGVDNMIGEGIEKVKRWKTTVERRHANPTTSSSQDHGGGVTSTTTTSTRIDYSGTNVNVTENYTNIKLSSVNTSISTSYTNGTVTSPSFNLDIADLFNVSIFYDVKKATVNLDEKVRVLKAMANNEDTANMLDLFKYIFNKILNPDYDKTEEEFKSIWGDVYPGLTEVIADGSYIVKTDVLGGLPALTKEQLIAGINGYLASQKGMKANALKIADAVLQYQNEFKVSGFFVLGAAREESGLGTNVNYATQGRADWVSIGVDRKEEKINTPQDSVKFFCKHVAKDYYSEGIFTIKDIAHRYCPNTAKHPHQEENWIEAVSKNTLEFYKAAGINLTTSANVGSGDGNIVQAAIKVHEYVRKNKYEYAQAGISVPNTKTKTIDCSSYVTWVLVEAGIKGFNSGMSQWNSGTFAENKYKWKVVSESEAMPGDILCYNGHVEIVAEKLGGASKFTVYNCGGPSSIKSKGTKNLPETSKSSHKKSSIIKILRVNSK